MLQAHVLPCIANKNKYYNINIHVVQAIYTNNSNSIFETLRENKALLPLGPDGPGGPLNPVGPGPPGVPNGPNGPVAPVEPVAPTGPTGPRPPGKPVSPVDPVKPKTKHVMEFITSEVNR